MDTVTTPGRSANTPPAARAAAPVQAIAPAPVAHGGAHTAARPVVPAQGADLSTWFVTAMTAIAGVGWVIERRRRKLLDIENDSELWAGVQPARPAVPPGANRSRREATLIDLHQLEARLARHRRRGDLLAAVLLLQQHLADFRYTSPWVFLELRELCKLLGRHAEWERARRAFRRRYGQNAPTCDAPSTADAVLLQDRQLCAGLVRHWPYREARMFVLSWLLGEHETRQKCCGPPLLALGVYRDLLFLDAVLDEMMLTRPAGADSLL